MSSQLQLTNISYLNKVAKKNTARDVGRKGKMEDRKT
jgi:hypothetical protein